ncbi:MAG: type I-D CRISPR-associated protein Cas7/Csc2, partial [Ktedonobacteraceae bacterium]
RDELQVMRHVKLNAIQDTIAGGIAGSAFAGRENVLPQIFIPTVETLLDVTIPEFLYTLGNILKTTRYGAESNREGFMRNHILGIYLSDVELFSNLELTQRYYDALSQTSGDNLPDYLDLDQFLTQWRHIESNALAQTVGRKRTVEKLADFLGGVRVLYEDESVLRSMLQQLTGSSRKYVESVKSKDKDNGTESETGEDQAEE